MNRNVALLAGLAVGAILLGWWFLLFAPKGEEIAEVESQIEDVQAQQISARNRINSLKDVRERAPEIEAQINAADAIIPADPALPAALRQIQMAADAAGVTVPTISISRPGDGEGANEMSVTLTVDGGYFQIIDFLRRIEDPTITPRGILWSSVALSRSAYPTLSASLSGTMYARNVPPAPVIVDGVQLSPAPEATPDTTTDATPDATTDAEEAA